METVLLYCKRIVFVASFFFVSLHSAYQKPTCYWYWIDGAANRKDLRDEKKPDYVWHYFWKMNLCRRVVDSNYQIPLTGVPSSLVSAWASLAGTGSQYWNDPVRVIYEKVKNVDPDPKREVVKEFETGYEGTGWHGKDRDESINLDLGLADKAYTIKGYIGPNTYDVNVDEIFTSIEQVIMIVNQARHYEYGVGKQSYEALQSQSGIMFEIPMHRLYHRKLPNQSWTEPLLTRLMGKYNQGLKYGDKVKLVSIGSALTMFAFEENTDKKTQVFMSHADTPTEISKLKKLKDTGSALNSDWFFIKGPFKDGTNWNCKLGDAVKNGDIVRLEHAATGKCLEIDKGSSPAESKLFLGQMLGFEMDTRYRGSKMVANEGGAFARSFEYVYPNKPTSDELAVKLSSDSVGSKDCNFTIKCLDQETGSFITADKQLCKGQIFALGVPSVSDKCYLWSQHAFFNNSQINELFGLVSALIVDSVENDVKHAPWAVYASDSPDNESLNRIKFEQIVEGSTKPEENLATFLHVILKRSDNKYFSNIQARSEAYPAVDQESVAMSYLNAFITFYKTLNTDFWQKFVSATDDVRQMLEVLKKQFPNSTTVLDKINGIYLQASASNVSFKSTTFKGIFLNLQALLAMDDKESELKTEISNLFKNDLFMLNKQGFSSIDEVLSSNKEPQKDGSNKLVGQFGASLLLAWLVANKDMLINTKKILSSSEFSSYEAKLKDKESFLYPGANNPVASTQLGIAQVQVTINTVSGFLDKTTLSDKDREDLLSLLSGIVDNHYDVFFTPEQVLTLSDNIVFLKNKHNFQGPYADAIDQKLNAIKNANVFGIEYLLARLKTKMLAFLTIQSDAQLKPQDLIDVLKNIVSFKAHFEVSQDSAAVISAKKQQIITDINSALSKSSVLKTYEDQFNGKSFAEKQNTLAAQILLLQESPTLQDYYFLFLEAAKQIKSQSIPENILQTIKFSLSKLMTAPYVNQLTLAMRRTLISMVDSFKTNYSLNLGISVPDVSSQSVNFASYLKVLKDEITSTRDNSSVWKSSAFFQPDSGSKDSFLNLCEHILRFSEFSPDFSDDSHKMGLISVLKFVQKSINFIVDQRQFSAEKAGRLNFIIENINKRVASFQQLKDYSLTLVNVS